MHLGRLTVFLISANYLIYAVPVFNFIFRIIYFCSYTVSIFQNYLVIQQQFFFPELFLHRFSVEGWCVSDVPIAIDRCARLSSTDFLHEHPEETLSWLDRANKEVDEKHQILWWSSMTQET